MRAGHSVCYRSVASFLARKSRSALRPRCLYPASRRLHEHTVSVTESSRIKTTLVFSKDTCLYIQAEACSSSGSVLGVGAGEVERLWRLKTGPWGPIGGLNIRANV